MTAQHQQRRTRAERTRHALKSAFIRLLFERRYDAIKVDDIVVRADVGRSTFYEHYRGKDDILGSTMAAPLSVLAEAAVRGSDTERLPFAVAHFWENRRLARTLLAPPTDMLVKSWLGGMIEERLAGDMEDYTLARIQAVQIAAAQLALLEAWLTGRLVASQEIIARALAGTIGDQSASKSKPMSAAGAD